LGRLGPTGDRRLAFNLTTGGGVMAMGRDDQPIDPFSGQPLKVPRSLSLPLSDSGFTSQRTGANPSRCHFSPEKVRAVTERGQWQLVGRRTFRVRVRVNWGLGDCEKRHNLNPKFLRQVICSNTVRGGPAQNKKSGLRGRGMTIRTNLLGRWVRPHVFGIACPTDPDPPHS
jgi:hypothetical protein